MSDCLGDCFERDAENRRVLKFKPNGGLNCGPGGLFTYPHDQDFSSNYIGHSGFQQYQRSTPNPINTGIVAPGSDGLQHTPVSGPVITNSYPVNALVEIQAKADLFIMARSPLVEAMAQLQLEVTIDDTNWAPVQHSSFHSIVGNSAFSSGQIGAIYTFAPGISATPKFGIFYTNLSGAGAAFIRATNIYITVRLHAQ